MYTKVIKVLLSILSSKKGRQTLATIVGIILSPVLFGLIMVANVGEGGLEHNKATINTIFNDQSYPDSMPSEMQEHMDQFKLAFNRIDDAIADQTSLITDGSLIDNDYAKSVFMALNYGNESFNSSAFDAKSFVNDFVDIVTEEVPIEDDPETDEIEEGMTTKENVSAIKDTATILTNVGNQREQIVSLQETDQITQIYTLLESVIQDGNSSFETGGTNMGDLNDAMKESEKTEFSGENFTSPIEDWSEHVSSAYGIRPPVTLPGGAVVDGFHNGIDLSAAMGDPIYTVASGKVVVVKHTSVGLGIWVAVDHGGGIITAYGHCSKINVSVDDEVVQGQQIAEIGQSGWATGPHLHLIVYVHGATQNPRSWLH